MVKHLHWRAQPDTVIEQMYSEDPYPLKGAFIAGTNFLVGTQNPNHWKGAFEKLDFNVVVDLFMTPTAMALADVVLPSASFAERDGVRAWWSPLTAQNRAIRVGECRSDAEICFDLSNRLNPEFQLKDLDDLYQFYLKPSGYDLEGVRDRHWIMPPKHTAAMPYHRHEEGLLRADGAPGFNTPSGKIELASSLLREWGYDPLPSYKEPDFSPVSRPDLAKEYPLILNTGSRTMAFFHSEHRQIESVRLQNPDPLVEINPDTARSLDIEEGDWVWIENQFGQCKMRVKYSYVHPEVVMTQRSWWEPESVTDPDFGAAEFNANMLMPLGIHSSTGFGGNQTKSMLCRLRKVDSADLPATRGA